MIIKKEDSYLKCKMAKDEQDSCNRIALILGSNIHWAPYYYRYEKILTSHGISFDLLIWNREGIKECSKGKLIEFKKRDITDNKDPKKFISFLQFSHFVKKCIQKNGYSKLIFLGTHACAPVLLHTFLQKNYKEMYWLDIRDRVYEDYRFYYKMEVDSIANSYTTVISSKGYEQFLPPHDYYYMHNIDPEMDKVVTEYKREPEDGVIRISFIGNVRYYDENVRILNVFANKKRFVLQYFGAGSERLKEYCERNKISNVRFHGRFSPEETVGFYNCTDIVNNAYGNSRLGLRTALSNKLYYSLKLHLPILVSSNTYMETFCRKYGLGFTFNDDPCFPDHLYEEYMTFINRKDIIGMYDAAWNSVIAEDSRAVKRLDRFLLMH